MKINVKHCARCEQINARWNPAAVGVGAIAPVLQANSPSRVLFDTGAGAIGASSLLNEAATFKYSPAAGISMFCILKQSNSLTNVVADVLRLSDGTVNNNVMIRHNSAVVGELLSADSERRRSVKRGHGRRCGYYDLSYVRIDSEDWCLARADRWRHCISTNDEHPHGELRYLV